MTSSSGSMEKRIFKIFIGISLAVHLYLLVFGVEWSLFQEPEKQDELVIETDLVFSSGDNLKETSLDKAKIADEVAIQKQALPQLTKAMEEAARTVVEQESKEESIPKDSMPLPSEKEKTVDDSKDKNRKLAEEKAKAIEKEKKERKEKAKAALLKNLKEEELKRRLAREKLRREKKLAAQDSTIRKKLLNRGKELADRLAGKNPESNLSDEAAAYLTKWKSELTKNFSVPAIYEGSVKNKKVVLGFKIDAKGKFNTIEIVEGSGDDSIDALLKQAAENTINIGKPPRNIVGRTIHINYTF